MTKIKTNRNNTNNVPPLRFPEFSGEWKGHKLRNVCKLLSGGTPALDISCYWNGNIPFISAAAMHKPYIIDSEQYLSEEGLVHGSKLLKQGNLLLLVRGSMLWKRVPVCYNKVDVAFNQDVKGIIPNNITDSSFLLYWFLSQENRIKYMVTGTGIGAGKLDMEDLLSMKILIPPQDEQRKVVSLLQLIDNRIATQNKIIEKLETLIKALSHKLTTQQRPNTRLKDCLTHHSSTLLENDVKGIGQYPVYGATGICGYMDKYEISGDSILIIKDGASVGSTAYATGRYSTIGTLNYLRTTQECYLLPYIYYSLKAFDFRPYITGMAIPHIYFKDYSKAKIWCPAVAEQKRIATTLRTMGTKLQIEHKILRNLILQKQYLLSNLFI